MNLSLETFEKLLFGHSERSEESLFKTNWRYFASLNMTIIQKFPLITF